MKILILNGPNLNMLGKRDKKYYGSMTLKDINKELKKQAGKEAKLKFYQTNSEGKIVTFVQKHLHYDALIINAGAYTHTSIALHDALELFKGPIIEVHLSNILAREAFRQVDYIKPVATKCIMGLQEKSYYEALSYLLNLKKCDKI